VIQSSCDKSLFGNLKSSQPTSKWVVCLIETTISISSLLCFFSSRRRKEAKQARLQSRSLNQRPARGAFGRGAALLICQDKVRNIRTRWISTDASHTTRPSTKLQRFHWGRNSTGSTAAWHVLCALNVLLRTKLIQCQSCMLSALQHCDTAAA
jgi:hypothetical protein